MTLNRTIRLPRRRNVSVVTRLGSEPRTAIHHRLDRSGAGDAAPGWPPELPATADAADALDAPDVDPPDVPAPRTAPPPEAALPPLAPADAPAPETWTEGVVAEGV
jgi:hypothetical protein